MPPRRASGLVCGPSFAARCLAQLSDVGGVGQGAAGPRALTRPLRRSGAVATTVNTMVQWGHGSATGRKDETMPSSKDRRRLEVPTYIHEQLVQIARSEDR